MAEIFGQMKRCMNTSINKITSKYFMFFPSNTPHTSNVRKYPLPPYTMDFSHTPWLRYMYGLRTQCNSVGYIWMPGYEAV